MLGAQQGVDEVDHESGGHDAGECVVEDHGSLPRRLKPFARIGVADRQGEEAEPDGQHDEVEHVVLLSGHRPQHIGVRRSEPPSGATDHICFRGGAAGDDIKTA